jgi:hypothetical protein
MLKATDASENSPAQHPRVAGLGGGALGRQHRQQRHDDGAVETVATATPGRPHEYMGALIDTETHQ